MSIGTAERRETTERIWNPVGRTPKNFTMTAGSIVSSNSACLRTAYALARDPGRAHRTGRGGNPPKTPTGQMLEQDMTWMTARAMSPRTV